MLRLLERRCTRVVLLGNHRLSEVDPGSAHQHGDGDAVGNFAENGGMIYVE